MLGDLLVAYNSMTGTYALNPGNVMDAVYVRMSLEIGEVISKIYIGGPNNTKALDIIANVQGVFVLLNYYPYIQPHPLIGYAWSGINGSASASVNTSGIMYFSWNNGVIDMQAFLAVTGYELRKFAGYLDFKTTFMSIMLISTLPGQTLGLFFTGSS
jgi:hypothetical protein